jgi:hypothetical protein
VTRIRNTANETIQSLALLYPGIRGALASVTALEPGDVAKLEATLPAGATKDQIQIIFSTPE